MRRVVITGMGAITPLGNSISEFSSGIFSGRNGISNITKFDSTDFSVKLAAEVKDFDGSEIFGGPTARRMDLFTQYACKAAKEAVADSGIIGSLAPERLGVYVGSGIGGMRTFEVEYEKLLEKGPRRVSPFFVPMLISNMAAGLIAIEHNAKGPTLPVVTACATSTNQIGEAYRSIKHGYSDAIIAGGAEAAIIKTSMAGFSSCMALSTTEDPNSASIPFDKRRSGFVMGEGSGIIVMEEYEHAKARGAKIYAEIVGYGNTCDAYHITAPIPDGSGAAMAMKLAIEEGGLVGISNLYINTHGTSTPLNDKTETMAIKKAFGEKASSLAISSTKSMTGHMLGAAGAVEAIATILALKEGILPPTIGYKEFDPECDLDIIPNTARNKQVDCAISVSLGFGGHNAVIAFKPV